MRRRLAPVVAVLLGIIACGGSGATTSPTTPSSPISPAGSWSGSISDAISGDGTMQLALSEQAASATNSLVGTWAVTFKNGESFSGEA
jgi:hypothetical protein